MQSRIESLESRRHLSAAWETVDEIEPGELRAMTTDAAGNVYAVGEASDGSGAWTDVIRMKASGGDEWTTIFSQPVLHSPTDIAVAPNGDIYVAFTGTIREWERSAGKTTLDVVTQGFNSNPAPPALATDASGNVYAAGQVQTGTGRAGFRWVVRKQSGGRGAFVTVDSYVHPAALAAGNATGAEGITVIPHGPAAGVYVVGWAGVLDGVTPNHWIVRRSTDGGSTWSTVDDYSVSGAVHPNPVALSGDAAGNLYVTGTVQTTTSFEPYAATKRWETRKGVIQLDGSFAWSSDDAHTFAIPDYGIGPRDIAVSRGGDVYVTGWERKSENGRTHSIVRTNAGGGWRMVDDFQVSPVQGSAGGNAIAIDGTGKVYAGGYGYDDANMPHWFIRSPSRVVAAAVVGRHAFYNNSSFDGGNAAANAADAAAVASGKVALLPGQAPSFVNVTSYDKGINGVIVDINDLPAGATLTADDFEIGGDGTPPASVSVRRGAGVGGSDRLTLTSPDFSPLGDPAAMAVANGWLRLTVKASPNTGLARPDVFSFGNLIGETGDGTGASGWRVSALDLTTVKRAVNSPTPITSATDFNRDGRTNALDLTTVRRALNQALPPYVAPATSADRAVVRSVAADLGLVR